MATTKKGSKGGRFGTLATRPLEAPSCNVRRVNTRLLGRRGALNAAGLVSAGRAAGGEEGRGAHEALATLLGLAVPGSTALSTRSAEAPATTRASPAVRGVEAP